MTRRFRPVHSPHKELFTPGPEHCGTYPTGIQSRVHRVSLVNRSSSVRSPHPTHFQIAWKLFRWTGNFQDSLENSQMVIKLFSPSGNFPDSLDTFQVVWKLSRWSGNSLDGLETFRMVWKNYFPASPAKFLRVKVCHPESFDFFGLCFIDHHTS